MLNQQTEKLNELPPEKLKGVLESYIGKQAYERDSLSRSHTASKVLDVGVDESGFIAIKLEINGPDSNPPLKDGVVYRFGIASFAIIDIYRNANEIVILGQAGMNLTLTEQVREEVVSPIDTLAALNKAVHLLNKAVTKGYYTISDEKEKEIEAAQSSLSQCTDSTVPEPLASQVASLAGYYILPTLATISHDTMQWLCTEYRFSKWTSETNSSNAIERKEAITDRLDFARSAVEAIEQLGDIKAKI